jgi:hypothetical protein
MWISNCVSATYSIAILYSFSAIKNLSSIGIWPKLTCNFQWRIWSELQVQFWSQMNKIMTLQYSYLRSWYLLQALLQSSHAFYLSVRTTEKISNQQLASFPIVEHHRPVASCQSPIVMLHRHFLVLCLTIYEPEDRLQVVSAARLRCRWNFKSSFDEPITVSVYGQWIFPRYL